MSLNGTMNGLFAANPLVRGQQSELCAVENGEGEGAAIVDLGKRRRQRTRLGLRREKAAFSGLATSRNSFSWPRSGWTATSERAARPCAVQAYKCVPHALPALRLRSGSPTPLASRALAKLVGASLGPGSVNSLVLPKHHQLASRPHAARSLFQLVMRNASARSLLAVK